MNRQQGRLSLQVLPSDLVRCNPDRGRVHAGATLDMELTISCMEPQSVNTQVCHTLTCYPAPCTASVLDSLVGELGRPCLSDHQ